MTAIQLPFCSRPPLRSSRLSDTCVDESLEEGATIVGPENLETAPSVERYRATLML
jgi:hypothetical protein